MGLASDHDADRGQEQSKRTLPKFLFEMLEEEYIYRHGALPYERGWNFSAEDIKCDPKNLLVALLGLWWTRRRLPAITQDSFANLPHHQAMSLAVTMLNRLTQPPLILDVESLPETANPQLKQLMPLAQPDLPLVNRLLLEELFKPGLAAIEDRRLAAINRLMLARRQSALCLSGGGIRSATFSLGAVEGLARAGLLTGFDYLSTVSGGGYLGGWLSAWMHRHPQGGPGVEEALRSRPRAPLDPEPAEILHLRSYSNYLTPRAGLLSLDTWAGIGIYLRNLLLNWTVLVPLTIAILFLPQLYVSFSTGQPIRGWGWSGFWVIADSMLAWFGLLYVHCCRPSLLRRALRPDPPRVAPLLKFFANLQDTGGFWMGCVAPLLVAGILLTSFGISHLRWYWSCGDPHGLWFSFAIYGVVLNFAAWILPSTVYYTDSKSKWLTELVAIILTGCVWGVLLELTSGKLLSYDPIYYSWEVALFWGVFLLAATIFVGGASRSSDEEDREWWGRFGGAFLVMILTLGGLCFTTTLGPRFVANYPRWGYWLYTTFGLSGIAAVLGAKSAKTPATGQDENASPISSNLVLSALAVLFAVALFVALAQLGSWLVGPDLWLLIASILGLSVISCVVSRYITANRFSLNAMYRSRLIRAYLGASRGKGERKPNPFTGFDPDDNVHMHDLRVFYPDCFKAPFVRYILAAPQWLNLLSGDTRSLITKYAAGATKDSAKFDEIRRRLADEFNEALLAYPFDARRLMAHFPGAIALTGRTQRPLHVVNMTLNLVRGENLAWQERKAESFTATPLHCGNHMLGYRDSRDYGAEVEGGGRTYKAAEGISLGSAVSISGAAASPNMGYNSSPVLTLLMTFFNVRLGAWLGNPGPAGAQTFRLSNPKSTLRPILNEALGNTDDTHDFVYLSDGGHFDNLGLYEMVLRRCRYIVVVDATADAEYRFTDLGRTIDKIRVDLGIEIRFAAGIPIRKFSGAGGGKSGVCAIAEIDYKWVDGEDVENGCLLYIKATVCGDEPVDILNYRSEHPGFPHQSTADQWFDESQFECYRRLGLEAVRTVLRVREGNWSANDWNMQELAKAAQSYLDEIVPAKNA